MSSRHDPNKGIRIILFPGMATNGRFFTPQLAAFPNLRVMPWITPLPTESVQEYAARIAPLIPAEQPCILGGASFGGIVALELATLVPHRACLLIGSIRSRKGLKWRARMLAPLAVLGPEGLWKVFTITARVAHTILPRGAARRMKRLLRVPPFFQRWATCAVLRWRPSPATKDLRIFQIHGTNDGLFPAVHSEADVFIANGEHNLLRSHSDAVNAFIADVLRTVAS